MRSLTRTVLVVAAALAACKTPDGQLDGSAVKDGEQPPATNLPLALASVETESVFLGGSIPASGIIRSGRSMKFFIDQRNPAAPKVWFINHNFKVNGQQPEYAKYHYNFAKKHLNIPEDIPEFNANTYFTETKRYVAGTLHTYKVGASEEQVYGVQFYPQDLINGAKAAATVKLVAAKVTIPGAKFAFVETGSQQAIGAAESDLTASGIRRLTLEQIIGDMKYIPLHQGVAFGYLRIFPPNQDNLTAADIPVFDDLPLDLTVVAGTLTKAFQDSNSHINLKSKERNTPNAVVRDAGPTHPVLAQWADKPIKLTVSQEGFTIDATTDAVIKQKLAERFSKPWQPIQWLSTSTLRTYDNMGTTPSAAIQQGRYYGGKAAHLGFLANKSVLGRKTQVGSKSNKLGYDLVPLGFAIPLKFYKDFVDGNPALKAKITELVTKEKANQLSAAQRVTLLTEVQSLFLSGKFPAANLQKIKDMMASALPGIEKVKIRSSANAEDIEGFDGAGLHDSYSAKPAVADNADGSCTRDLEVDEGGGEPEAKMNPRTIQCAIKGVYMSLWNKRAIEERSFARIDHASVSMGISVLPAYDYQHKIAGNSVLVTRVINTSHVLGYSLSVQKKNNLVTNPDPGTFSELSIAALGQGSEPTTLTFTRFAKPKKDKPQLTEPVLTKEQMLQMVDISRSVEIAYCKAKPGYYNGNCNFAPLDTAKPKSLDFEFKFLENGNWVCKQVREFSGK